MPNPNQTTITVTPRAHRALQAVTQRLSDVLGDKISQTEALEVLAELGAAALHADVIAAVLRVRTNRVVTSLPKIGDEHV